MKGDKGRQVNLSAWRAVPDIQAGRQRETNEGKQSPESRARQMKGDKGRQMNPPREPCQASRPDKA